MRIHNTLLDCVETGLSNVNGIIPHKEKINARTVKVSLILLYGAPFYTNSSKFYDPLCMVTGPLKFPFAR